MILVDSNVLIAYHNKTDEHHTKADKLLDKIKKGEFGSAYITDYIFDECITVLAARIKNKEESLIHCEKIKIFPMLKIEESTFEEAWNIFKKQEKLLLSFTDCTNLAFMKQNSISHLATFDTDFKDIGEIKVIET